jgi:hypothetical protein
MKRVLQRLDVYIYGDRLHQAKTINIIYKERMEREVQTTVDIPDHIRKAFGKQRETRKKVETSSNAPLLKRLNRNPQVLEVGRFVKAKMPRFKLEERKIVKFPKITEELLQQNRKVRKIQPMRYHIRAKTISIPSIELWLENNAKSSGKAKGTL